MTDKDVISINVDKDEMIHIINTLLIYLNEYKIREILEYLLHHVEVYCPEACMPVVDELIDFRGGKLHE